MSTQQLATVDRVLDELERAARSEASDVRFTGRFLEQFRAVSDADAAAIALPSGDGRFIAASQVGTDCAGMLDWLREQSGEFAGEAIETECDGIYWLASPISPGSHARGFLLAGYAAAAEDVAASTLRELAAAFCEILASRYASAVERFLQRDLLRLQTLCGQVRECGSIDKASVTLVNGLAGMLAASRVSVMRRSPSGIIRVLAVSGVPEFKSKSRTIRSLRDEAAGAYKSAKPLLRRGAPATATEVAATRTTEDGLFENRLCVLLSPAAIRPAAADSTSAESSPRGKRAAADADSLMIEFPSQEAMLSDLVKLSHLLPLLALCWEQHARWLRVPRWLRALAASRWSLTNASRLAVRGAVLAAAAAAVWFALTYSYPLIIEAEGVIEPEQSRNIYSTAEGFVEELFTEDGRQVAAGDELVRLRSPALELQIEQTQGEFRSLDEESKGVRVAINQLRDGSADAINEQSVLAAKVEELESRKATLQEQLRILRQRQDLLTLRAPIAGAVVAKDIRQRLQGRPVQVGDPLFSVVDMDGPWQIRVEVPDGDSGYVLDHYATAAAGKGSAAVEFVIESSPGERRTAGITDLAGQVQNRHGEGSYLECRARLAEADSRRARVGAGVRAFFRCGEYPLWFVWTRPMIEFVQRRIWF